MVRKSPSFHHVRKHSRNGYPVDKYNRGHGQPVSNQVPTKSKYSSYRIRPSSKGVIKNNILHHFKGSLTISPSLKKVTPSVSEIYIYGSHAYGTPTKDSDVDVLVVVNTKDRFHGDIANLKPMVHNAEKDLSSKLNKNVEIAVLPRLSRWEDFLRNFGMSKEKFLKRSIRIYKAQDNSPNYSPVSPTKKRYRTKKGWYVLPSPEYGRAREDTGEIYRVVYHPKHGGYKNRPTTIMYRSGYDKKNTYHGEYRTLKEAEGKLKAILIYKGILY